MARKGTFRRISLAALFALVYTLLFFGITNIAYWYFNRQFLYHELISDSGYYMYDWVGNAVGTVTMAVVALVLETTRALLSRTTDPG